MTTAEHPGQIRVDRGDGGMVPKLDERGNPTKANGKTVLVKEPVLFWIFESEFDEFRKRNPGTVRYEDAAPAEADEFEGEDEAPDEFESMSKAELEAYAEENDIDLSGAKNNASRRQAIRDSLDGNKEDDLADDVP